jgi:hypothetical protein
MKIKNLEWKSRQIKKKLEIRTSLTSTQWRKKKKIDILSQKEVYLTLLLSMNDRFFILFLEKYPFFY